MMKGSLITRPDNPKYRGTIPLIKMSISCQKGGIDPMHEEKHGKYPHNTTYLVFVYIFKSGNSILENKYIY